MANQMEIITTSLEALLQRATNISNQGPDTAAIDAFCGLVIKEPECCQAAAKFIIAKVHSLQEWEALQALLVLETGMKKCGTHFHSEIGKFKFLNELIKLVSPKYLGAHTPEPVRRRILELMYTWTVQFPRESKIKEAYDMLKKQGVVEEEPQVPLAREQVVTARQSTSILQDEEKSQLLQKLLQSKNPQDLQAANRLIKSMVKEEERRNEEKWRHKVELETVVNNCRLLNEMLDSYQEGVTSDPELELIKELHSTCQSLRPVIFKLVNVNADPNFCHDVLQANDELGEVFSRFDAVVAGKATGTLKAGGQKPQGLASTTPSLLDLSPTPSNEGLSALSDLHELDLSAPLETKAVSQQPLEQPPPPPPPSQLAGGNDLAELSDVFSHVVPSSASNSIALTPSKTPRHQMVNTVLLDHISVPSSSPTPAATQNLKKEPPKNKGFEELDILGETLLKMSLSTGKSNSEQYCNVSTNDVAMLMENPPSGSSDDPILVDHPAKPEESPPEPKKNKESGELTVLPLGDVQISLENIRPSKIPPFHALDEKNGVSTIIHLAKDRPRPDVAVYVVSTSSKNQNPISNFLFQPVVPKSCRLRLLPPSSTELPAHNPFLAPFLIRQIMLIASPKKDAIALKFIVSYTMDDETITEMGEISELLLAED